MKINFTGTCAHDYDTRLKTVLKNVLDKDARRSSGIMIDEQILIDCGEHTVESLEIQKVRLSGINEIFLTHLHSDHYNSDNIKTIAKSAARKLRIYAYKEAKERLTYDLKGENVEIVLLEYCKEYLTESGYSIAALPANHHACPAHYLIEKNNKKIYYATDGAWIMFDAFYYLRDKYVDLLVLDATVGDYEGDYRVAEHNSIPMIRLMLKSFDKFNIYKEEAKIYLTHIAPSLHKSHCEIVELMRKDGIEVAFDGLTIEI